MKEERIVNQHKTKSGLSARNLRRLAAKNKDKEHDSSTKLMGKKRQQEIKD